MSKKRTPARSSNAATSSSPFGGFGAPSTFSPAASQLSYVTEPPDLSRVFDGNLVVLFKNLLKKDDTTKAKALEDLQNALSGSSDVQDPVLAAWVRFPLAVFVSSKKKTQNKQEQKQTRTNLERRIMLRRRTIVDTPVPAPLYRHFPPRPPPRPHGARRRLSARWKEDREAHAQGGGCLAFRTL